MPLIPAPGRQTHKNFYEFEARLIYTVGPYLKKTKKVPVASSGGAALEAPVPWSPHACAPRYEHRSTVCVL